MGWARHDKAYLQFELRIFPQNGIIVQEKGIVGRFEVIIIPFQLLRLPPSPAILEPHSHLPWLQPQLLSQLGLPLGFQLVLFLKALLQQEHLSRMPKIFHKFSAYLTSGAIIRLFPFFFEKKKFWSMI